MTLLRSWVASANSAESDFPLNNLPYGAFRLPDDGPDMPAHCGVAIGDKILNASALERDGFLDIGVGTPVLQDGDWTEFMALGPAVWGAVRDRLTAFLSDGAPEAEALAAHLVTQDSAWMVLPFMVAEFTDFYASRHHATHVGTMFRGAENALPPNWLSIPIGYNGRASSVVVSGTEVRRPWGQLKAPDQDLPVFAPCKRFDFELELGAIVGTDSTGPVTVAEADAMIFGYVLLNDWSARDIQAWEYQPLGPVQSKATATSISPWIVPAAALRGFRCDTPDRARPLLPHLQDTGPMLYDIALEVGLAPEGKAETVIARTNYNEMYYSAAQQLAHHSSSGCPMNTGDLLGSGTISGADKYARGALLELAWGGKDPVTLDSGETRSFLEDGDTLSLRGAAMGQGFRVGFGSCTGKVLPALDDPYKR